MGPNFNNGARKIGRERLPLGIVAILDDPPALRAAIGEMHDFVLPAVHLNGGVRA